MKFTEYPYHPLNLEEEKNKIQLIRKRLETAENYEEFCKAFHDLDHLGRYQATQSNLVEIRHTINTKDEYYDKENDRLNEILPILQEDLVAASNAILDSPYCEQLRKEIPETFFLAKEMERKAFDPSIIEFLQKENKLASQYQALIASAQIEFDGETYNLASLEIKTQDQDRDTRKRAMKAYWGWFEEHNEELGEIYDQLVKVRDAMAKKMGFKNFIELGYLRMKRFDYDQNDVENYRKQVLEDVVPVANMLYERQKNRLGYDTLQAWDEKVEFTSGNPKPHLGPDEMVAEALKMYKDLSPETGEFFQFMVDHELLDLLSKPGKAAGGYCTYIPDHISPFIFANFNGTQHDVEVLTHEAGHAFQVYSSQSIFPTDCVWPTNESCEIHSMSMEFFTYPYMPVFFEEEAKKYYFSHLSGAVKFLPYGICVDHFQHEVYAHPEMTHQERMETWRKLEKMYMPHKNYEEIDLLEQGGWWMRQLHIFMDPFYYIDYTLAQVCALQFWARLNMKDTTAFKDYLRLCKEGGKYPFRTLVDHAHLKCPFEDNCLKGAMYQVNEWFKETKDPE